MRSVGAWCARAVAVFCLVSIATTSAKAQKAIEFLKSVPETPAFTFLGVTPGKIDQPGSLRDLGVSLKNGVGKDGKAMEGFALDASVWNLIPGFDIPLDKYRSKNPFPYMLANLQASIATVRSSGDSADLVAAFGLKAVIIDHGDPMLDTALTRKLAAGLRSCIPAQPGAGQSAACVDSVTADVIGSYTSSRWNATQLAFAVALGNRFENSEIRRSAATGWDAWLVGGVPLGNKIHLLGQTKYQRRTAEDTVPSYAALTAGVRAVGGSSTFNGFVELAHEWRTPKGGGKDGLLINKDVGGWSAGLEFRLAANTWVSTGVGSQYTALKEPERTVVFATVKWGLSSNSRLGKLSK